MIYSQKNIDALREILVQGALTDMSCSSAIVEFDKYIKGLTGAEAIEILITNGLLSVSTIASEDLRDVPLKQVTITDHKEPKNEQEEE